MLEIVTVIRIEWVIDQVYQSMEDIDCYINLDAFSIIMNFPVNC